MSVAIAGLDRLEPVATVSPLVELGSALHVLNQPDHHDARGWADEVREAMPSDLADETERTPHAFMNVHGMLSASGRATELIASYLRHVTSVW